MKRVCFYSLAAMSLLAMVVSCEKPINDVLVPEEETVPEEVIVESVPLVLTRAQEGFITADNTFAVRFKHRKSFRTAQISIMGLLGNPLNCKRSRFQFK